MSTLNALIAERAHELEFDACGFARATVVEAQAVRQHDQWIALGHHARMAWAERNRDLRNDPRQLLAGAQSLIVVAMNYFPATTQPPQAARVAYYAYGKDYHLVMRERMEALAQFVTQVCGGATRCCVDTAPLRERYWAQKAGVGFIGRNNTLIIPGRGSYFFLGVIVTTAVLEPSEPCTLTCGDCHACERVCPGGALKDGEAVDANRCLSYLTIEHRGDLPEWAVQVLHGQVCGCDICQQVCPHNRHARPTTVQPFAPLPSVMDLTPQRIAAMTSGEFRRAFHDSAIAHMRLSNLQRNASATTTPPTLHPDK